MEFLMSKLAFYCLVFYSLCISAQQRFDTNDQLVKDMAVSDAYFSAKTNGIPAFNITETRRLLGKISDEPTSYPASCRNNATCENIPAIHSICYGLRLPYLSTALGMTSDANSFDEVQDSLGQWAALRAVPKCWAVIQPLLCSVYLPKCEDGLVDLPSQEMCKVTRGPCRIVQMARGWPDFLKCENSQQFPVGCKNEFQNTKISPGKCKAPLIEVESAISTLDGVDGCGLPCEPPQYTADELHHIRTWTFCGILPSLLANFFVLATYSLDWKNAKRFPSVMVFYLNLCFFISNLVWLFSYYPGMREAIVCWKNGAPRKSEPVSSETFHCTLTFILFYSPTMTAFVCLSALAYAWYQLSMHQATGSLRDRVEGRDAYFYLTAFTFTLVMSIIALSTVQVDADPLSGICFLSSNSITRSLLLLAPMGLALILVETFHLLGFINFRRICSHASGGESNKLTWYIGRTAFQAILYLFIGIIAFGLHVFEFLMENHWAVELRNYIICSTISEEHSSECLVPDRLHPSFVVLKHWLFFVTTILASSCAWTSASANIWRQFYMRKFKKAESDDINRPKKHKVIAEAYKKRFHLQETGRLSISIPSEHPDPAGLALDQYNSTSNVSSVWAAALPHLMRRRNAVVGPGAMGLRRSSMDSEMSNCSQKRGSFLDLNFSRRQSLESLRSVFRGKFRSKRRSKLQRHGSVTSKESNGSLGNSSIKMKGILSGKMDISSSDMALPALEPKSLKKRLSKSSSDTIAPRIVRTAKRSGLTSRKKRRSRRKQRHDVAVQAEPVLVPVGTQTSPQTVQKSVQTVPQSTSLGACKPHPVDWTTTDESDDESASLLTPTRPINVRTTTTSNQCQHCQPSSDCQCAMFSLLGSPTAPTIAPSFRGRRDAIANSYHIEMETLKYSESNSLASSFTSRGSGLKISS